MLMLVVTVFFVAQTASRLIKIPKIEGKTAADANRNGLSRHHQLTQNPRSPSLPVDLRHRRCATCRRSYAVNLRHNEPSVSTDTLEIQVEHWDYYWKIPNDNHNTSWAPRIRFFVFYGSSAIAF